MSNTIALSLSLALLVLVAAFAQQATDLRLEHGERLYERHCALCHAEAGRGIQPYFPALRGNAALKDPGLLVSDIRNGSGSMPAFPRLTVQEISALATYVRNAWGNSYGSVSPGDVAATLARAGPVGRPVSIWDGVFSSAQADRGEAVYSGPCGTCHGRRLDGAPDDPDMLAVPPLAGAKFLRDWDGRSLATLFEYARATMPASNPGFLSDGEYIDAIAYMLSVGGLPSGSDDLLPNAQTLSRIVIESEPAASVDLPVDGTL